MNIMGGTGAANPGGSVAMAAAPHALLPMAPPPFLHQNSVRPQANQWDLLPRHDHQTRTRPASRVSSNNVLLDPMRDRMPEPGRAETIADTEADSRTEFESKKRQRSPDDLRLEDSVRNAHKMHEKKKQKPASSAPRRCRHNCAVCGAQDHKAEDHPYPNTRWGYLLCCAIHNTLSHSTADCKVFLNMDPVEKWMLAVRRRCNKAPLYTGQDTPTALMNATQCNAQHLQEGLGPWGTEFSRQAVGAWEELRNRDFFQSQHNTEGRGFHDLNTAQGREALKNSKDWATTQCFDPMVKGGVYNHMTWP